MAYDYMDIDESQGLLGWFEGTVLDSYWSTPRADSKGKATFDGADTTKLYWLVRVDTVHQDYERVVPESMSTNWGIGDKWHQDPENENQIRHEDDPGDEAVEAGTAKPILFKGSSMWGKFIGLCTGKYENYFTQTPIDPMVDYPVVLDEGPEVEYELYTVRLDFEKRGVQADPRDASIWKGMRFEFRGLGFPYRQTKGTPAFRATPVRFLGFDEAVASSDPVGNAVPPASEPVDPQLLLATLPEAVVDRVAGNDEATVELVEGLAELVGSSDTHTVFMRQALKLPMVKGDADIKKAVMNKDSGPYSVKDKTAQDAAADELAASVEG